MEVAVRALGAQLAEMRRELAETRREQAETRKEMEELRAMEQRVRMEVAQAREERQAGANEWRHQLAGVSAAVVERERETGEMARAVSALQCKVQGVQGFMRSRAGKGEVAAVRKRLGGLRKGVMGAVRREVAAAVRAEVAAAMGERRGAKQEVQGAVQREEQLEEQREERREECESESKCGSECEHKGLVAQLVQENATLMCEKTVAEAELRELRAQLEALRASQQREGMGMDMGLQPVQGQEEAGRVETHDCKELAGESTAVAAREGEVGEVGRAISALQATVQGGMQSGYVGDVASKVRLAGAWKDVLEAVKKEVTEVVLAVVTVDEDDGARVLTPMQKLRVRMLGPHSEREFRRAMGQRMLRAMCDCENKGCVAHLVQESSEPEYVKKANDASAEVKELKEALGAALRRNDEMGAMVEERAKELAQVKGELNRVLAEWQRQLTEAPRELDVDKEIRESTGDRREIWQAIQTASQGKKLDLNLSRLSCLSDAMLGHVSTMTHLEYLHLDESSGFSALGMRQVYSLPGLVELFVRGAAVTDEALEGINVLKNLERLFLSETDVSDEGLRHLPGLTSLRELFLSECWRVTSAGMVHVGKLKSVRMLGLRDTGVKDDGLRHLASLTRLEILDPPEGNCISSQEQLRRLLGSDQGRE